MFQEKRQYYIVCYVNVEQGETGRKNATKLKDPHLVVNVAFNTRKNSAEILSVREIKHIVKMQNCR